MQSGRCGRSVTTTTRHRPQNAGKFSSPSLPYPPGHLPGWRPTLRSQKPHRRHSRWKECTSKPTPSEHRLYPCFRATAPACPPLYIFNHALRARVNSYPQHRLLCHLGEYKFEFQLGSTEHTAEVTENHPPSGNRKKRLPIPPSRGRIRSKTPDIGPNIVFGEGLFH